MVTAPFAEEHTGAPHPHPAVKCLILQIQAELVSEFFEKDKQITRQTFSAPKSTIMTLAEDCLALTAQRGHGLLFNADSNKKYDKIIKRN